VHPFHFVVTAALAVCGAGLLLGFVRGCYQSLEGSVSAHVDGALETRRFATALKSGNSCVTRGPVLFSAVSLGSRIHSAPGASLTLGFDLAAVAGLKHAQLVSRGRFPIRVLDRGRLTWNSCHSR